MQHIIVARIASVVNTFPSVLLSLRIIGSSVVVTYKSMVKINESVATTITNRVENAINALQRLFVLHINTII